MVENYAVVERVRVQFHAGLNLLTGETGSGKSIVVDALGLVLGGRASADMVRADTERARVAAIFEAPREPVLLRLLEQAGVPVEEAQHRYVVPKKFKDFRVFSWEFTIGSTFTHLYAEWQEKKNK